jgi:glucosamine-6-phosphate deaminase
VELIVVPSEEFARAASGALDQALNQVGHPRLGLPTGSTPIPLYRWLGQTRFHMPPGARCFAVDEYVTPHIHAAGTNASFFHRHWSTHLPPVAMPCADAPDPEAEIAAYCRLIAAEGGLNIVLLGIGRNGHLAFNEPGSRPDSGCRVVPLREETRAAAAGGWPEEPPSLGVTVGMREILAARHVVLLATGVDKRRVLTDALHGPVTSDLPASFLQEHPALTVVCDNDARPL